MVSNLSEEKSIELLQKNYIGHLSYIYQNKPFVIPITYYYIDNTIICYSNEGHKTKALRENKRAAMCVTNFNEIDEWQSVQVEGIFEEIEGSNAKFTLREFVNGVKSILLKEEGKKVEFVNEFSSKTFQDQLPIVFKIHITNIHGKESKD